MGACHTLRLAFTVHRAVHLTHASMQSGSHGPLLLCTHHQSSQSATTRPPPLPPPPVMHCWRGGGVGLPCAPLPPPPAAACPPSRCPAAPAATFPARPCGPAPALLWPGSRTAAASAGRVRRISPTFTSAPCPTREGCSRPSSASAAGPSISCGGWQSWVTAWGSLERGRAHAAMCGAQLADDIGDHSSMRRAEQHHA